MHTWRFSVSCFEVLDANKVRFKLKKGVLVVKFAFATAILKIDLAHAQTFCTRVACAPDYRLIAFALMLLFVLS